MAHSEDEAQPATQPVSSTPKPQEDERETRPDEIPGDSYRKIASYVAAAVLLLVFYVLSIGPVALMFRNHQVPKFLDKALEIFYAPLQLIWNHSQAFRSILQDYINWLDQLF